MQTIIFNRDEKRIADLNPALVVPLEIEDISGEYRYIFEYPADEEDAEAIVEGHFVAIKDLDGAWQLFEIVYISTKITADGDIKVVECEHAFYELATEAVKSLYFASTSAEFAVTQALAGTRWQVGTVHSFGNRTTGVTDKNPLGILWRIKNTWDGELRFRVTLSGTGIAERFCDLLSRRGAERGRRFEVVRDIAGIEITVDSRGVKTALTGRGIGENFDEATSEPERIDFSTVEWVKGEPTEYNPGEPGPVAPVDKPAGQEWVGDPDARDLYGKPDGAGGRRHIYGLYESQAQSPERLLWETWNQLQKVNSPLINIQAHVVDLEQVEGFEHEKVRLGDTVYVIVRTVNPAIEAVARVLRIERKRHDPGQTRIELGNYRLTGSKLIQELSEARRSMEGRQGIWDRSDAFNPDGKLDTSFLDGKIDVLNNELISTGGYVHVTDTDGIIIYSHPTPEQSTSAIRLKGGILAISNEKTPEGEWIWRTFGTGEGFTADEINAGRIRTNLVRIEGDTNFYWDGNALFAVDPADQDKIVRIDKAGIRLSTNGGQSYHIVFDASGIFGEHIKGDSIYGTSIKAGTFDLYTAIDDDALDASELPISTDGNPNKTGSRIVMDGTGIAAYYNSVLKFLLNVLTGDAKFAGEIVGGKITSLTECKVGTDLYLGELAGAVRTLFLNSGNDVYLQNQGGTTLRLHSGQGTILLYAADFISMRYQNYLAANDGSDYGGIVHGWQGLIDISFSGVFAAQASISFGSSFGSAPIVLATAYGTGSSWNSISIARFNVGAHSVTASGCTIAAREVTDTEQTGTLRVAVSATKCKPI